jgi:hypothetical protein
MAEAVRSHSTRSFSRVPLSNLEDVKAHVVFQDVIRYQGFVDARIFIGLQMNQGFFRHALVRGLLYKRTVLAKFLIIQSRYTLLLGVIGVFGVVTGGGSRAPCGSVFTASKFKGRMMGTTVGIALPTLARLVKWGFRGK